MALKPLLALILTVISILPTPGVALSEKQLGLLEWARSRFETAGLIFPTVNVVFYEDLSECELRIGKYNPYTGTVHLCRFEKRDVLHEFAHAWADQNLDDDDRKAFQQLRGLATWGSHEFEWSERAVEHVAETITWALMDENLLVRWVSAEPGSDRLLSVPNSSHEELVEIYEALTGRIPTERLGDRPGEITNAFSPELARMP